MEALGLTKVTNPGVGNCLFAALLQSLEACRDPKWKKHLVPKTAKDVRSSREWIIKHEAQLGWLV